MLYQILSWVRAKVRVIPHDGHTGKSLCESLHLLDVHGGSDVYSAMTDVNANLHNTARTGVLE